MRRSRIDVNLSELDEVLDQAKQAPLSEADCNKLKTLLHTLVKLLEAGRHTEKTRAVVDTTGGDTAAGEPASSAASAEKKKTNGHGRNPASAYAGATKVEVPHPTLKSGDACPECPKGKVYVNQEPRPLVRVVGQAPLGATVYALEQLRCNACGQVYTAPAPECVGPEKYDATAQAMIAELKYGSGVPFNRIENLEKRMGVPLPSATQWEMVEEAAVRLHPVRDELIRQAAQGELFHNDDTSARILKLERPEGDERTGVFTSAVVSVVRDVTGPEGSPERRMALYFSGCEHAGENLAKVLKQRAEGLGPAMLMSDALSRNVPKLRAGVELLWANCMAHGRRNFVEVVENFPTECRYVLETLGGVYANDAETNERKMTPAERLEYHQQHSQPLMEGLKEWMTEQFRERKVEPNSGLGKAIAYLQKHWSKLTLFLREPGAPLDNNICERALKLVVLHRKNALFYRTKNGAQVGDLFMSLIHTCQLNGVNSFDYLVELLRHAAQVAANPRDWMPWCYRATRDPG
jgi:transposase